MIHNHSVLMGKDYEVLDCLIELHAKSTNKMLDCTYNKGTMWKNCKYQPHVKMDIVPSHPINVVADFCALPFDNEIFDVIVFDPPHLTTDAASENSSKMWEDRYGITNNGIGRDGDNISGMFLPFLVEAKRVLNKSGIIIAKIADMVHNHRYQWHHVDYVNEVNKIGMTPCDLLIKKDPSAGNLQSSKWKNAKHLRKCHCYFIVVRNGKKCEK